MHFNARASQLLLTSLVPSKNGPETNIWIFSINADYANVDNYNVAGNCFDWRTSLSHCFIHHLEEMKLVMKWPDERVCMLYTVQINNSPPDNMEWSAVCPCGKKNQDTWKQSATVLMMVKRQHCCSSEVILVDGISSNHKEVILPVSSVCGLIAHWKVSVHCHCNNSDVC